FQAEDGIRDYKVTGVQTCALPIFHSRPAPLGLQHDGGAAAIPPRAGLRVGGVQEAARTHLDGRRAVAGFDPGFGVYRLPAPLGRSEERRVGKEWRCRWGRGCWREE